MKTIDYIPTSKIERATKLVQTGAKVGVNYLKYYGEKMVNSDLSRDKLNENNAEDRRNKRKEYYYSYRKQEIANRGEHRKKNVDMHRGHKYMQLYGITLEQYEDMRYAQNYKCAICGLDEKDNKNKKLFVDHCHETKKVRALLCLWCNSALGSFRDNINILEKATAYLKEHNASG